MNKQPELIPIGEDRKIKVFLKDLPEGVTMDNVDVTFTLSAGHVSKDSPRASLRKNTDGDYYIPFSTSDLAVGDLIISAHVRIPDEDFEDGKRDEYPTFDPHIKIIPKQK